MNKEHQNEHNYLTKIPSPFKIRILETRLYSFNTKHDKLYIEYCSIHHGYYFIHIKMHETQIKDNNVPKDSHMEFGKS